MNDREWYYLRNGEKTGPVSMAELRQMAATGQLQPHDTVWKAGMPQWAPAQTIPELFTSPPPPPHSPHASPVHVHVSAPMTPQKSGTKKWMLIGGLLIGGCCGVPGLIMMMMGLGHKVQKDQQAKQVATAPALEVSLTDIVQAYKENEVAANQKYKGKVVQVSATVNDIKDGYVWLDSGVASAMYAHAEFKDKAELATLRKEQPITLKGLCTGKGLLSSVNLENCVLVAK